jgi:tetratricopeptide (TPR) repeat protein
MGGYQRAVTTHSADAQRYFDQGMTWAFAFNHDEAIRSFREAARLDPSCAMAWWGVALCHGPHINKPGMEASASAAAWDALRRARSLVDSETAVERELIEALSARYAADPPADRRGLDEAYAGAMKSLRDRHPRDADIAVLCAESMMDLRPWDLWTADGRPHEGTEEIVSTLETALALSPEHPGAIHLLIHAVEASADPGRASAAADRLRTLVPASGHLVHMPSHIDVRTGKWAHAAETNERAIAADAAYRRLSPRQGFYRMYMAHNLHFLSFVSMMEGRSERAVSAAREMLGSVPAWYAKANAALVDPYLSIEMDALKRFGRWEELLRVAEPRRGFPITHAMWRHGRGVALAAVGRVGEARVELDRLRREIAALPAETMGVVNKAHEMLAIAERVLAGEVAYAEGDVGLAISRLKAAAAIEDRLIYMEPPEWAVPVRHVLGAMLVESGRAAEAEAVYLEDLREWPENGWSLFGLEQALRAQGRLSEAEAARGRFERAFARADAPIESSCACVRRASRAER